MKPKLILIRGLPGSGKSTLANELAKYYGTTHLETDMFWGSDYKFDITRIKEAHEWCQNMTREALLNFDTVVVSNTFTTKKELAPYFEIAKEFDIIPQVVLCQNTLGNVHNVPQDTLERMSARFEFDISELFKL